jgi:uncharacterized membrane protein YtjA (UPF0391 family)
MFDKRFMIPLLAALMGFAPLPAASAADAPAKKA